PTQLPALALLFLRQEGQIPPSGTVLSFWPEPGEYDRPVTFRNLLDHTGGLKDFLDLPYGHKTGFSERLTPREPLGDLVSQTDAVFPPGDRHDYSHTGYFL
ncbi:beta-lactamase family protein, partial [Morganella morganii]|uniref:serine hydrolase n=1 Tax=Morganella morganii TaxID=582 RepID=UPI0015F4817C